MYSVRWLAEVEGPSEAVVLQCVCVYNTVGVCMCVCMFMCMCMRMSVCVSVFVRDAQDMQLMLKLRGSTRVFLSHGGGVI